MTDLDVKQRGFGAVQIVLVVVVLGVIASAGWLTYSHYQKAHQAKQNNAATTTPSSNSATKTPVTTQQPAAVANQNVESIPELGIQITVPDDIKDLKYQVTTVTLNNGSQDTIAWFSTTALINADSNCGPSAAPLGTLGKVSGQYPTTDPYAQSKYGRLVKQFPTFYIAAGVPNAACSTNASANGTAVKFKSEFSTAVSTIQQTSTTQ